MTEQNTSKKTSYLLTVVAILILVVGIFFIRTGAESPKTSCQVLDVLKQSQPINAADLKALINGNSLVGATSNTKTLYQMYFKEDGTYIFQRGQNKKNRNLGKWWIEENYLCTEKTVDNQVKLNKYQFFPLYGDAYTSKSKFGDCAAPEEFCPAFLFVKGNAFNL